ncbi:cytochrome c oxidase assembly protein subunit 15 [Angomonas deanei]|nr:cytochrome c oxidase assembly protein subunit 15 [Angomonas deanei]|eukprot:EPY26998.1 cytochrome c oxidase assembly protein subunit 15 [Angomonas deanei]
MTLTEFKFIFFWEWAHRVLARSVGVVFGVPLLYYMYKGRFAGNRPLLLSLWGILSLGGAQGFMGWYMVSSGLDHSLIEERKKVTVSSYRLASHLFLAFLIYAAMLRVGYGLKLPKCPQFPGFKKVQLWSRASCSVMFLTAMSGAFVAGLDAGLMYNDGFPLMAGGIIPPMDHLTALEPWWRNFFENHAAAQTTHRLLAGVTFLTIAVLNSAVHRGKVTPQVMRTLHAVNGALILQVLLGMWTVISQVDIPVAASHQFGALLLLSTLIRMCAVVGSRGVVLA